MQWILRRAGLPDEGSPLALSAQAGLEMPLRVLATRLAGLKPAWTLRVDEEALSPPTEQALARLLGWPDGPLHDGRFPWTAWEREGQGLLGSPEDRAAAWGCLTPAHGLVGSDRITLLPPGALQLSAEASRAMHAAIEPLFASEGVGLEWHSPLAWHVRHESLNGLPCASLERVVGDSVQAWQARGGLGAARLMRRLQNEAQMVLHAHPLNEDRAARGLLPVNTLWLSGCGAWPATGGPRAGVSNVKVDDTLSAAWDETHARGDPAPWLQAWAEMAMGDVAQRFDAAVRAWHEQQPDAPDAMPPTIVLCGPREAHAWTASRPVAARPPAAPSPAAGPGWLARLRQHARGWRWSGSRPAAPKGPEPQAALIERLRSL